MLKKLVLGTAAAACLAFAGSASAATYITNIEHDDTDLVADGDFGLVTIEEEDANNILVTVTLNAPLELIVDTGKHNAFTFNLSDSPNSTVTIVDPVSGYTYAGEGTYSNAPFGNDAWKNAIVCCGQGASNGIPPPLVFRVTNLSGITFAGVGATFDIDGRLLTTGTGNRFASTAGGWWFGVDTADDRGQTGVKAARDAFIVNTAVPEPATWAMMILGFGAAGAMIRRRKTVFA